MAGVSPGRRQRADLLNLTRAGDERPPRARRGRGKPRLQLATLFAFVTTSLMLAAPAQADVTVGTVDNRPAGTADGGAAFFALMNDVGLKELRYTVQWDPAQPTTIPREPQLAAMLPVATLRGIKVV